MQQFSDQIANIEVKIRQLAKKHNFLRKENEMLQLENKNLKKQLNQYKNQIKSTGQTTALSGNGNGGESGISRKLTGKLKEELDLYILEIDKCVEMVKNL